MSVEGAEGKALAMPIETTLTPEMDAGVLLWLIDRVHQRMLAHVNQLLRDLELTGPQYMLLRQIADTAGSVPSGAHLARMLGGSQASVGVLLITLKDKGMIRRVQRGQVVHNTLTNAGIDGYQQAATRLADAGRQHDRLLAADDHGIDLRALINLLIRLFDALAQERTTTERPRS